MVDYIDFFRLFYFSTLREDLNGHFIDIFFRLLDFST